jgi:mRNA interferase RelE/StbE
LAWSVEFDPDAVKDLKKLGKQIQRRILEFLRERLARLDNPRELGEALAGSKLGNYWKYLVGDWRIICDLQDQRIVVRVLRVGNRREVYRT